MCLQTANQARTFETESSREREYDDDLNRDGTGGNTGRPVSVLCNVGTVADTGRGCR